MTQPPADHLSTLGPNNYEQTLPPVARANGVTQVAPAKKITFYKSGDPQFGGVKMAINQRTFKSFNALMDDLSHRVPLPFGVRTITTPRGIHCISTLDQLEDGGCYLCSDKKYATPVSLGAAGRKTGPPKNSQPASAARRAAPDPKPEDHAATGTPQGTKLPKKITLVRNGDITAQRPFVLSRKNARSFRTLLDEISEIMQYSVKKLYTLDGKKIDSLQTVLLCPNVLICVGQESFKPIMRENSRKGSSLDKLPGLTSHSSSNNVSENNEMDFGLKAKKSVIHPRSSMSNRSARLSLSSEKSYPNGLTSSENGAPSVHSYVRSKGGDLVHDDIEKKVHVNKDGSLSVEMKVRFRLINDETLQWSTQIKKSSLMNKVLCEEPAMSEDHGVEPMENPEASSEMDDSLYPCDADSYVSNLDESESEEPRCHNCGKLCKTYDIWKNPMLASQKEEPGARNTWHTHSSCSSTSSHRRIVRKKVASVDSIRTSSSGEEYTKHVVRESSHYTETVENTVEYHSVKKCSCPCDCLQANSRQSGSPGERDAIGSSANSQKDDDCIVVEGEAQESQGSRPGSTKSKASQCSVESQIQICEEACSVERTISSSSIKERKDLEDALDCSSSPHSIYSPSSKCSTPDGLKDHQDEVSENDQVISSFSTDSCHKNDAAEGDAENEESDINEAYSVSEKAASGSPAKDDISDSERCSTGRSFCSKSCDGDSKQSDSNEVPACSAASSSSRTSRRSKHSQNHLDAGSNLSYGSHRRSTTKKKQPKSSLHAEDARSSSRTSYYSRSSHEAEKRDLGCHASHNSSTPHSNVSSFSETAAPPATNEESASSTSKCYSRSTRCSQKGVQPEGNGHTISPCSSFSDSGGGNGCPAGKGSSESDSSRLRNFSESTCSKCGQGAETWPDDLQSVSSRISSHSVVRSQRAETEASRRSDDACSQSSVAPSSKRSRRKTGNLCPDGDCSSQASASASASVYSLRCPAPPKGRPSSRKSRPVQLKKKNHSASACTESEPVADTGQKETAGSQSPETDVMNGIGDLSDRSNKEETACPEKAQEEPETEAAAEGDERVIPSSLPNTSPEDVVQEWLRKIPSDALLMKCEMQDDGEGAELDGELPSCSSHQEALQGGSEEKKEEGKDPAAVEAAGGEADQEVEEVEAVEEEAQEDKPEEEKSSEVAAEKEAESSQAGCNLSALSSQNNHKKDLPDTIQTSVQIMKALLASKQEAKLDRSHSLPEVSPTMGRKLSHSANILITCLASLRLLDEELDSTGKSSKGLNRPLYTELLNIFQALWFESASEKGATSSGLQEEDQAKVPSSYKGRNSKDGDFTPMSSSGVDVSSGDGGSGEGSMAGAQDCALSPEKMDEAKPTEGEEEEDGREAGTAEEEAENKEVEDHSSRPLTPCSASEAGEKVESDGGEKAGGAEESQGSPCEIQQEEEKEMTGGEEVEEDSKQDENTEGDEMIADAETVQGETEEDTVVKEGEDEPTPKNAEEATEDPINHEALAEATASEGKNEEEPPENGAKELVDKPHADTQPDDVVAHQPLGKVAPLMQQRSLDPDPTWVLRLLKKIEKEFMTHYVSAMNELKVKWNLPDTEEVDNMISEVKDEVSKRIQRSIEKELMKIRSRAGQKVPRPPDQMQRESTLQVENRRRRLQSIHKMSLYNDRNANQSKQLEARDVSGDVDEGSLFSTIRDDDSDQPSEEEYCPCDACIRKKLVARATRPPVVVATNAPVVKAFDLQQILRLNKTNVPQKSLEIAEKAQEEDPQQAEGEAAEPGANQETGLAEEGEAGETKEQEVTEEQEVKEDEAGSLREDGAECEESEEAERESAANEEGAEEAKEEMGEEEEKEEEEAKEEEEETQEGKEEVEEGDVEEEKEEEEAKEEMEEEEEKEEGEEMQEGKEEEVEECDAEEEKEEEDAKEEEEEMQEGKEEEAEECDVEEEKEEEEAKEEMEEEEEKEEEEAKEEGEEEEVIKEGEEEEEGDVEKEEEEEEAAKEEVEQEKEEDVEEKVDVEEQEKEEESAEQEEEENKEVEEEEENVEGGEEEEEETKEGEGGEEEQPVEEEEEKEEIEKEMEERVEEDEEREEGAHEQDNQEEEAKSEEEGNEKEEGKDVDEGQEETQKEDGEEGAQGEDETESTAAGPEAEEAEAEVEGESQRDASECAENADGVEGSETEAAREENGGEGDAQASDGEEAGNDAGPEADDEPCLETAEEEGEGENNGGEEAEAGAEDAREEETVEPVQTTPGDEEDPPTATEEGEADEILWNPRKGSAISSMGNFSQQSQKGSEEANDGEDGQDEENAAEGNNGEAKTDSGGKPEKMYPDSEEEEEEEEEEEGKEGRASRPASAGNGTGPKADETGNGSSQASKTKVGDIDQDDLDF